MTRYKWETAHDWLEDYLQRNPNQAHSIAMSLAMKLDSDQIQDEFQSDMDVDGYFEDLDAAVEDDGSEDDMERERRTR